MGWSPGDAEKVELAKVNLSKARSALYTLKQGISNIHHAEKREAMLVTLDKAFLELDIIDVHLNR